MATPTYRGTRRIDNDTKLPNNSAGKKRVMYFHLDDNLDMLGVLLERSLKANFSVGGVTVAGTVTRTGDEVRVEGRQGVTKDATQVLGVIDETYDFGGVTDGYYLLVIEPTAVEVVRSYVDPATGQTIQHAMIADFGKLGVQYDAGAYPTLADANVPVAQVQVASGAISAYTLLTTAPTYKASSAAPAAHAASHEAGGADELEIALSQIPGLGNPSAFGLARLEDADEAAFKAAVNLEAGTDFATPAALAAHEADTTSIHGITDTAQLALRNTANTFSSLQTFSAGLTFGQGTLGYFNEQQTWTPTLYGSTVAGSHTYAVQLGTWARIGKQIICHFYIDISSKDAAMSGNIYIGGLPFTARNSLGHRTAAAFSFVNAFTFGDMIGGRVVANENFIRLQKMTSGGSVANLASADVGGVPILQGTVFYEAA